MNALLNLLASPLTALLGIGPKLAVKLNQLGYQKCEDLLWHIPRSYQDRTQVTPCDKLQAGKSVLVVGRIIKSYVIPSNKPALACKIEDETGELNIRFFFFRPAQKHQLSQMGQKIVCFGEVRESRLGLEMFQPEYQLLADEDPIPLENVYTAIYPTTEGVTQKIWRKAMRQVLDSLLNESLPSNIPNEISHEHDFMTLADAFRAIHQPPKAKINTSLEDFVESARKSLALEELIAYQKKMSHKREQRKLSSTNQLKSASSLVEKFVTALPFELTAGQLAVHQESISDFSKTSAMRRLVQGDVGSGKTVVAAMSALALIEAGYQVALMAPTSILAEQHYQTFKAWFDKLNIKTALLTGGIKNSERQAVLDDLKTNNISMMIGTHALFQNTVEFNCLGLVIIDEQHRFGVNQREALIDKGKQENKYPHQLVMTATPIPRTLAMTIYADMDVSQITEKPIGRKKIQTVLLGNNKRDAVIERVKQNCMQGRQCYWICTLIEESDTLQCETAENTLQILQQALSALNIGLVHGRMKAEEKDSIMRQFSSGELHVLVATTVVEVGVDVSNASLMVIENPERLGLSQLHQLRGRVGRGDEQSYCVLLYQAPLTDFAKPRLQLMRDSDDGFEIAAKDLEMRGPGDMLGTRQSGLIDFKCVDFVLDQDLMALVQNELAPTK